MILKASQRGGGAQLGTHLLKEENEHVEVHEVRGFVANDVKGAFKEAQAVALGTRCKQYLFSVSLSPPETESVSISKFETALDRIEAATGLTGQPRVVVFHEKEGRRHCHAVWSRIDTEKMIAVPLPHFKRKLREISKGLYLEHGWPMPRGFMDSKARDPRNFTLAEWQQAQRTGSDPRQLKSTIQECWAASRSRLALEKALEERGLYLARGDRRSHVVVTYDGQVFALARVTGRKAKEITAKLGAVDDLRDVAATRVRIAHEIAPRLEALIEEAKQRRVRELEPLNTKRLHFKVQHSGERQRMTDGQASREMAEAKLRAARFRSGVAGVWDRLTGKHVAIRRQNERESLACLARDRAQREALIVEHLRERRDLQKEIRLVRARHASEILRLHRDLQFQRAVAPGNSENATPEFNRASARRSEQSRRRTEPRGSTRRGQELDR